MTAGFLRLVLIIPIIVDTQKITEYLFLNDADPKGDIAFVFGTWKTWEESVNKAAELYKKCFVPKVIVCGGLNPNAGVVEGDFMAAELGKLGIPAKDIMVENKSTNTLENVTFSIPIIDQAMELKNVGTITAVVRNYHSRRAIMTLRKHMPAHMQLKAAAYTSSCYPFTKENWHQSDLGKEKILRKRRFSRVVII